MTNNTKTAQPFTRVAHAAYTTGLLGTVQYTDEFGDYVIVWDNATGGTYRDEDVLHAGNIDPDSAGADRLLAALAR